MVIGALKIDRSQYRSGYQTTTNVGAPSGHAIPTGILWPRGPLKAEFRNGVLVVVAYQNLAKQDTLWDSLSRVENS